MVLDVEERVIVRLLDHEQRLFRGFVDDGQVEQAAGRYRVNHVRTMQQLLVREVQWKRKRPQWDEWRTKGEQWSVSQEWSFVRLFPPVVA